MADPCNKTTEDVCANGSRNEGALFTVTFLLGGLIFWLFYWFDRRRHKIWLEELNRED